METEIARLVKSLFSPHGSERQNARQRLVEMGKTAIPFMIGLQYSRNQQVQWEAVKTLSEIAHPDAIPILINALENSNADVRWLAAEGLVQIGRPSVPALMEALEERADSIVLREGVHHVLTALRHQGRFEDAHDIIGMLRDPSRLAQLRPTAAVARSHG
ncbi:MAG: HEAT repeat domain-containing protein [Bacteroidetes bacterium]|nr:HEAT repeat domain-containing protein [Bacteroidota bacterium]